MKKTPSSTRTINSNSQLELELPRSGPQLELSRSHRLCRGKRSTVTCHLSLDLLGRRHYMIQSFADPETARLFHTEKSRRFSAIKRVALRKLIQMNRARVRQDLAVPPGNCLEALKGKLAGYDSIRINKQWRIIFIWTDHGPDKVSIVDHH